ncbi:MAG: Eco57I restriction-modification methylase domain-containing protein [Leptospiraceae bacterium]|nr:Eco57I restriction-modification methylase domain-containing protein [Leptospiraceae bacterium]
MFTKEESKSKIQELTENFADKLDFIKTSGQYKEAQIEDEFIKPLFRYLNWNISNEGIKNPAEREFIVQAQAKNGKEPDYLLQLDKNPLFYIEAKHSKYDLQKKTDFIWQAYSYSYSTQSKAKYQKVDFALLTDFEEFRFFDCTFPVKNHQTLNNYCVIDWKFQDYIQNFDKLWEYFERENVRNGSLQSLYINEKKIKENRIPPDKAFLKDLDDEKDGWRIKLAKDIKKYQPDFSAEFITQAVQLILDRFIFIKVLSDRDIEEDIIKNLVIKISSIKDKEEGIIYDECRDVFDSLDKTYNGSIFTKRSELDEVKVSNKILLEILKDLLPENSRYNFKVIPIEILGTIYEQFLGKVVVTTDKRASIDYKPEIRKAGGVYYTPDYIVDYIVEKTVGEKLKECKKLEDLLEIKICDPACGSGSFLITAYDHLIQWTISYYESKIKFDTDNDSQSSELKGISKEERKLVYMDSDGQIRLTSKIKRDILKSCIYGVDIDAQAVEVTKMSLSLKALENTNHYEVYNERTLFHTTILPTLEGNIKCGNSLVGTDIYEDIKLFSISDKEKSKINAFDWRYEFSNILNPRNNESEKENGFDCIIGNPPYIRIQALKEISPETVLYYNSTYETGKIGNYDIYILFVEQALKVLLNNRGLFGFILPSKFFTTDYGEALRSLIIKGSHLSQIIDFKHEQVFDGPSTYTCLLFLSKMNTSGFTYRVCSPPNSIKNSGNDEQIFDHSSLLENNTWVFSTTEEKLILKKLSQNTLKLLELPCAISRGSSSGNDSVFIVKKSKDKYETKNGEVINLEPALLKIPLYATDFNRYSFNPLNDERIIFPYVINNKGFELIQEKELKREFPNVYSYLLENKKLLEKRKQFSSWYSFSAPRSLNLHTKADIVIPLLANSGIFALIPDESKEMYCLMASGGFSITIQNKDYSPYYILGLLNSKLLFWNLRKISNIFRGGWITCTKQYFGTLPIKIINVNNRKYHDDISNYVSKVMELKQKTFDTKVESIKNTTLREMNSLNRKIDFAVYELYELSSDEIKIVEGGV